jgi:hypothetical protein
LKESPALSDSERSKYLTPEFLKSVATLDPVAYLSSLKTKSVRLQQTANDPVTPNLAKQRIAAAVPIATQVVKYANAKDLLEAWKITGLSGWIKQQMRSQAPKASGDARGDLNSTSQVN